MRDNIQNLQSLHYLATWNCWISTTQLPLQQTFQDSNLPPNSITFSVIIIKPLLP